ncbi:MAG: DUF167 domain-containing protein [Candidatus Saccharicenans sp.]|nr:DUF167 domain-containing protein [Candidatus Saccharicenans sp.]
MSKRILVVRVQPGSSKRELVKISDNEYRARLNSPPEKGRANQELLELLSDYLKIPVSRLKIVKGKASREKWVEIEP